MPLPSVALRLFWRLPAALLALVYIVLFAIAPPQLLDVLSEAVGSPLRILLGAALPLGAVAIVHIASVAQLSKRASPAAQPGTLGLPLFSPPSNFIALAGRTHIADTLLAAVPLLMMAVCLFGRDNTLAAVLILLGAACIVVVIGPAVWRHAGPIRLVGLAIAGAIYFACMGLTLAQPVWFPGVMGPLAIASIGLACLSLGVAALYLARWIGVAIAVIAIGSLLFGNDLHNARRGPPIEMRDGPDRQLPTAFVNWLTSRHDLAAYRLAGRPYPVLVSAAEGGGIYAAAHSFAALTAIQTYCPNFASHLFAAVGVSGGSWGTALFDGTLPAKTPGWAPARCTTPDKVVPLSAKDSAFGQDFLSPILATLLFVESFDVIIPGRAIPFDRGEALERAFEATGLDKNGILTADLYSSWQPESDRPALALTSTDVRHGDRYVFMPFQPDKFAFAADFYTPLDEHYGSLTVSTAAGLSSRFPWVSPAGRLAVHEGDNTDGARLLADGGYFDNSGTETVVNLFEAIRRVADQSAECASMPDLESAPYICNSASPYAELFPCRIILASTFSDAVSWKGCDIPIYLYAVTVNAIPDVPVGYTKFGDPVSRQSFLFDPIQTFLSVWSSRSQLALQRMELLLGERHPFTNPIIFVDDGYSNFNIDVTADQLFLGWKISEVPLHNIFVHSADFSDCELRCGFDEVASLLDLSRPLGMVDTGDQPITPR